MAKEVATDAATAAHGRRLGDNNPPLGGTRRSRRLVVMVMLMLVLQSYGMLGRLP